MIAELEPLDSEHFSLRFPYHEGLVRRVKALQKRRWNKDLARWEVHISHLADVIKLFKLPPESVSRKLVRAFQIYRIRNVTVRVTLGNVVAQLTGADLPADKIDEATSFLVPGHQFMPAFVEGKWDGRRRLWDRKKQTVPAGLVPRLTELLRAEGVEFDLIAPAAEEAALPTELLQLQRPPLELRDYQRECIEAALQARRGVIELATGSGKTAVATWIIYELKRPALFVVHTRDLLHQTRASMAEQLGVEIGQIGDGKVDIRPVTVATVQTCAKALGVRLGCSDEEEPLEEDRTELRPHKQHVAAHVRSCPVVFFDECHHLPADSCYQLAMETHSAAWRFGLSATPYRSDRMDLLLEAALGPKLYRASASTLIERGYLVAPRITFHNVPAVDSPLADQDYQSVFLSYVLTNPVRNGLIVEQARTLAARRKSVLVLVSQVRHGEILRELMSHGEEGQSVPLVQGSDPAEKRREIFQRLERKELLTVIATTLADEGLDIPSLDAVILASGGKSETRALQRLGRALRAAPGKKHALVTDFFDNAPYLREHSLKRARIYQSEPMFEVLARGFKLQALTEGE